MNEAVALDPGTLHLGTTGLADLAALIGLPSKRKEARELASQVRDVLAGLNAFFDIGFQEVICAQNAQDFRLRRNALLPNYATLTLSLANVARVLIPNPLMERVVSESLSEVESEIREEGVRSFGETVEKQAMFTMWTLRHTSVLISRIANADLLPEELK